MITVKSTINAPIEVVWQRYLSPEDIVHWNAASDDWHTTHAEVDLRVGGSFFSRMEAKDGSMGFDFAGVYTQVEPHSLVVYEFGDRTARVEFSQGEGGVDVSVSFDPENEFSEEQQRFGWQAILDRFKGYVEKVVGS